MDRASKGCLVDTISEYDGQAITKRTIVVAERADPSGVTPRGGHAPSCTTGGLFFCHGECFAGSG